VAIAKDDVTLSLIVLIKWHTKVLAANAPKSKDPKKERIRLSYQTKGSLLQMIHETRTNQYQPESHPQQGKA